jgi:uncharacterized phage infection (PIP) family protein YhgE
VHVLTKIFIVLVALLAVLLVPLVVVYAYNENSFQARYQTAESLAQTQAQALRANQAAAGAESTRLGNQIQTLQTQNSSLSNEKAAADATIRQLESQLASANGLQAEINAKIATIAETVKAGHELTETLVGELRELRTAAVRIEREKVQLDEALREVTTQLDVAEQARRALAEELARLKDENAKTMAQLSEAVALGFDPGEARAGAMGTRIADVTLNATVIRTERSANQQLIEIDAGSRDGVKDGWVMSISRGGEFIGNLQIINVDINRATGKLTLKKGDVQVGDKVSTVAGQR